MAAPFGLFGTTQSDLTASGFFHWFNLVDEADLGPGVKAAAKKPGETIYRPSGEAFQRLVLFKCRSGVADATLQSLELNVARAFIEDARQSPFARDIAKSFLESIAQPIAAPLRPLIADISYRDPRTVVFMRGDPPSLPDVPAAGYVIFSKPSAEVWTCKLPGLDLTIRNVFGPESGMNSTDVPGAFRLRADRA